MFKSLAIAASVAGVLGDSWYHPPSHPHGGTYASLMNDEGINKPTRGHLVLRGGGHRSGMRRVKLGQDLLFSTASPIQTTGREFLTGSMIELTSKGERLPLMGQKGHSWSHVHLLPEVDVAALKDVPVATKEFNVRHYVNTAGDVHEDEYNHMDRKVNMNINHYPVFHKQVDNHWTKHDEINKEIYHHMHDHENRFFDVGGKTLTEPQINIDHGHVGLDAYGELVSEYKNKKLENLGDHMHQLESVSVEAIPAIEESVVQMPQALAGEQSSKAFREFLTANPMEALKIERIGHQAFEMMKPKP